MTRWGRIAWPGLRSYRTASYTQSQGTAPGVVTIRANKQLSPIAAEGDFVIYDGVGRVTLRDSKLKSVREVRGPGGVEWEIILLDRRWKWQAGGHVNLFANQLDPQGKFIGWTLNSLKEMCAYCLDAMGEAGYEIDMPDGLSRADGAGLKDFLTAGVNFPPTGVNPPVNWFWERPAAALEQLCEMFGRRVCWRWKSDTVSILPRGTGLALPPGSIRSGSAGLTDPLTPDGAAIVGSGTRYQGDWELGAVGREWDGTFKPVNALSYAPLIAGAKHKVAWGGDFDSNFEYYVTVNTVTFTAGAREADADMPAVLARLAAAVNASQDAQVKGKVTAAVDGLEVVVTATQEGPQFDAGCRVFLITDPPPDPLPDNPAWATRVVAVGATGRVGWDRSPPPLFPGVRATKNLSLAQARDLARGSVWQYYQLTGRDASGAGKINVPGYGRLDRRQQLVLLQTQCEQVVPDPGDYGVRLRDGTNAPIVTDLYNGLSRDKPAAVYGAVYYNVMAHLNFAANKRDKVNTLPTEQVRVSFSVDPEFQVVKFGAPVYKFGPNLEYAEPTLYLRCAAHVREAGTNQIAAYSASTALRPPAPGRRPLYVTEKRADVQLNVIPTYGPTRQVTAVGVLDADPIARANYYLAGLVQRFQVTGADCRDYNGIVEVELDGAIAQITWSVGDPAGGCVTTASRNYEHNTAVAPYPARRLQELLAAAARPGGFIGDLGGGRQNPAYVVPSGLPKP